MLEFEIVMVVSERRVVMRRRLRWIGGPNRTGSLTEGTNHQTHTRLYLDEHTPSRLIDRG